MICPRLQIGVALARFSGLIRRLVHNPSSMSALSCPVNRERTMAADGWAVAESASQIRLAPELGRCMGRVAAADTEIFPATLATPMPGHCPVVRP
jgi:hypothetical protein